ncbi:LptA/OstA family protein [Granulibacter bethesdensis]|uniref:LptA/OstA family protein n=1 Tax=Granulibacter bethesdensis TaxID=364410 RepID=UPI0003F20741|nr:LptA/OstA family protein [Granulibacter bethesdensis]AHJ65113.1 putative secreted protein [Granulibacter bethesdensis CGDNIH4]
MTIRAALLTTALAIGLPCIALAPGIALAQSLDLSHGGPVQVTAQDGIDWRQQEKEVVARGNAVAIRDNVTVRADTLIAHYRKKETPDQKPATPTPAKASANAADESGANEIYRLEAVGNVHIYTDTDQAWGDRAIYDMDQAILLLTGKKLKLTTPQDVLTARDSLEYWAQKRMSVARGDAVLTTNDGKRIKADTLVGYSTEQSPDAKTASQPKPAAPDAQKSTDPASAAGKLQRAEAYGNVEIRTPTETAYGDRGVYVPDTGIARLIGHVRITRGQNQVNGAAADVNLKTGISTLLSARDNRVQGMIVPSETGSEKPASSAAPQKDKTR